MVSGGQKWVCGQGYIWTQSHTHSHSNYWPDYQNNHIRILSGCRCVNRGTHTGTHPHSNNLTF